MDSALSLIGIGVVAFVSTNLDDLVMLVAFFADGTYRASDVVVGQFVGIIGLVAISLVGALLALVVPASTLGLLGLVPIIIGLKQLWSGGEDGADNITTSRRASPILTVALLTLANGGDNLSLYIPLFSTYRGAEIAILVAVFLAMTALWCAAGYLLVRPRRWALGAQRWGKRALPLVMIGLGIYILAKTGALTPVAAWLG